jgi:hypothetical protein
MTGRLQTLACTAAFAFAPVMARAVVIQQENGEVGAKDKRRTTMYLDNGRIRVEADGATGKTVMIFDDDRQVMWLIQPNENSYSEITRETIAGLGQQASQANQQMSDAMKKMQEQMANMPPQQRAMMEQIMKGRGMMPGAAAAPAAPRQITFTPKGGTDKVGQFTCSKYDEMVDGKRTAEVCAASFDQVQLKDSDLRSLQAMAKFFEPLQRMAPRGGFQPPNVGDLKGFPVHSISYDGDKPAFEVTVLSVDGKPIDASMFSLPAGLQKKDMFGGRGRGPF